MHQNGTSLSTWDQNLELNNFYRVVTSSTDDNKRQYVSSFEAYSYPFYGIMYHIERSMFFGLQKYPHNPSTLELAEHLMFFFVDECSKSKHTYGSYKQLM